MTIDLIMLINKVKEEGAEFILRNDQVILRAPEPIPPVLLDQLRIRKTEIHEYLIKQMIPKPEVPFFKEWRRISIPVWRRVLAESFEKGDSNREKYAKWMLSEVLEDRDYKEGNSD